MTERQRVARLATVDLHGHPHQVPIVFAFDEHRLYSPIDTKPKRVSAHQLQRVRNIQVNPFAAVLFDEYSEDWSQLAWVLARGKSILRETGFEREAGLALLIKKYPQYRSQSLTEWPVIVIEIDKITSWKAKGFSVR